MTLIIRPGTRGYVEEGSATTTTISGNCICISSADASYDIAGSDPMETVIVNKIAEMLGDVTTVNGYRRQLYEINKKGTSFEDIKQFPCVNVVRGNDITYDKTQTESGRHMKTMTVMLEYVNRSKEDQESKVIDGKADMELLFGDDTVNASTKYNLEGVSLIALLDRSEEWSIDNDKFLFGFDFYMDIIFRQSRKNPAIQY